MGYNNDMDKKQYLDTKLKEFGIKLSDEKLSSLIAYHEMLTEKNKVMNLTAITDFDQVCIKHFLDSLAINRLAGFKCLIDDTVMDIMPGKSLAPDKEDTCSALPDITDLIDVGCGAGFPGLPIAIAYPDIHVTLLDSLNKRVGFLNEVTDRLNLKNVTAIHARAEDLARSPEHREKYDVAVSRAVANLATLSEYCLPFVREGGFFVAYKSSRILQEGPAAQRAISILGGEKKALEEYSLPGSESAALQATDGFSKDQPGKNSSDNYRCLYIVSKVRKTPPKYPRKAGLPSKEPL